MTNINGHYIAIEDFDFDAHALAPGYFEERIAQFESQYRDKFPSGWPQFFAAYSSGKLETECLDYDEWAFLCEHFMRELTQTWQPPGTCVSSREKPEVASGFSFGGGCHWLSQLLIPSSTSASSKRRWNHATRAQK
jgi:hypothetical protein